MTATPEKRPTTPPAAGLQFRLGPAGVDSLEATDTAIHREIRRRWLKFGVVCLALISGGWYFGHELSEAAETYAAMGAGGVAFITAAVAAFFVASATPFVPGAEIGFGLLLTFGSKVAIVVYLAMVSALTVSFLVGRLLPVARVADFFGYLGLNRARDLTLALAPLAPEERLRFLAERLPPQAVPVLLRHRYLAIIILLNLPGNSVIGGRLFLRGEHHYLLVGDVDADGVALAGGDV